MASETSKTTDHPPSFYLPFLRSCQQESPEPQEGKVTGTFPEWVRGTLIRDGSGLLQVGEDKYNHLFDGLALLHRFHVQDGKATYQNRFLRSDAYKRNMKANRIVVSEFGTRGHPDPCKTLLQRFMSTFTSEEITDNDLVNIIQYGDDVYACTETQFIRKINPETLESLDKVDLAKYVAVNTATAHAHSDNDGTVYNLGNAFGLSGCAYKIVKFPKINEGGKTCFTEASVVCTIPAKHRFRPCYFHSFGLTENYFIFVEQPLYLSFPKMMIGITDFSKCMQANPKDLVTMHVIRRDTGEIVNTKYTSEAFFVFHHINAYEEDDHLVVDMACYRDCNAITAFFISYLEENILTNVKKFNELIQTQGRRYVLPLETAIKDRKDAKENLVKLKDSKAEAYLKPDGSIFCIYESLEGEKNTMPELPRINYEVCNGKKYQYYYAVGREMSTINIFLSKVDTVNKSSIQWREEGAIPSEPIFIPAPKATDEDEGIILASVLYNYDDRKVSLLCLDAKTMKELARADFEMKASIPGDFHGVFLPTK